jgi:hypothetical protein
VVLADVEQGPLDAAVESLRTGGHPALGVRTDVRDPRDMRRLSAATVDECTAAASSCRCCVSRTRDTS